MDSYAYAAPTSVEEAVDMLGRSGPDQRAQALAGGTDMIVQMRSVDPGARLIVDLKRIPDTRVLELGADGLRLGASVPAIDITGRADIAALWPGLIEAIDLIGSSQIQGRASVGGNLCNASPAGDTIPALIANAAVCEIAGPSGRRELPVEDFVTGVQRNALEAGELLVALRLPHPGERTGDSYLRFTPRTEMDIAVASAGVRLSLDEQGLCTAARVAIGAVATTALLVPEAGTALVGTPVDEAALDAVAAACSAAARPITDKRGTEAFRRQVVGVMARRATARAVARAKGEAA